MSTKKINAKEFIKKLTDNPCVFNYGFGTGILFQYPIVFSFNGSRVKIGFPNAESLLACKNHIRMIVQTYYNLSFDFQAGFYCENNEITIILFNGYCFNF